MCGHRSGPSPVPGVRTKYSQHRPHDRVSKVDKSTGLCSRFTKAVICGRDGIGLSRYILFKVASSHVELGKAHFYVALSLGSTTLLAFEAMGGPIEYS